MKKVIVAIAALVMSVSAFAWDGQYNGSTYGGNQARQAQTAAMGVVEDIRKVRIVAQNDNSYASYGAAAVGAGLGGLVGSKMGKGSGKTAATIVMGALGGAMGYGAGNAMAREHHEAVEIVVTINGGRTIAVTQGIDENALSMRAGDRVRVIGDSWGNATRVVRISNAM